MYENCLVKQIGALMIAVKKTSQLRERKECGQHFCKGRDHFLLKQSVVSKTFLMCLKDAQKKHSDVKYNIFMEVCKNFQPVFRYFCMEKFLDPALWFEKRLAYTRSVATSSIGIGLD